MVQFDRPEYFYFLAILLPMVLLFVANRMWMRKKQREFGDLALVRRLAPDRSATKPVLKLVLFLIAIGFLVTALANPKIGTKTETVKREGIDIVFAVDVSKSMLCEDVAPSRLEKAKQTVSQVVSQLSGDRIGIIAYAAGAYPVLPITTDYAVSRMFLQSMNTDMVSSQGTSLGEAITLSETFFDKKSKTNKLLIMLSDGEDHESGAEDAANQAKKAGIKIITIGLGTAKGGPIPLRENGYVGQFKRDGNGQVVITRLNEENLRTIAKKTDGGYVYGGNSRQVGEYVKKALENIERTEFESQEFTDFNSQFQWFLGFALLLLFADLFLLERKTEWIRKLNLFNEREK